RLLRGPDRSEARDDEHDRQDCEAFDPVTHAFIVPCKRWAVGFAHLLRRVAWTLSVNFLRDMTTNWSEAAGARVRRWRAVALVTIVGTFFSGCAGSLVQLPVKFSNATPGAPLEIVGTLVRPAGEGPFP